MLWCPSLLHLQANPAERFSRTLLGMLHTLERQFVTKQEVKVHRNQLRQYCDLSPLGDTELELCSQFE